jgi:hypothetical protein
MTASVAKVRSTRQLVEDIAGGGQPKYAFFRGHQPQPDGSVGKGCSSQWWPAGLVEASPRDRIWGIGMGAANDLATSPGHWRGLNLLGFALIQARRQLR